jgi:hypothetical protein
VPNQPIEGHLLLASAKRVNPRASAEAGELVRYLYLISGQHLLSGQHNQPGLKPGISAMSDKVKEIVGRPPAIWGNDFGLQAASGLQPVGRNHSRHCSKRRSFSQASR